MKLTGKCKEDFEKWYMESFLNYVDPKFIDMYKSMELTRFNNTHPSMQYGVRVDFSETVEKITNHKMVESEQSYIIGGHTRVEARTFTVEKFDKRYNQNIK